VSESAGRVDTLFLHAVGGDVHVVLVREAQRLLHAVLELKETDAGPRPARFRVKQGAEEALRRPEEFVKFARGASRIRISEQTPPEARRELQALLDGYQLEATVVRTCRYCANRGRYSPVTAESAIRHGDDHICADCANRELERELARHGDLSAAATDRLEELVLEVQDLDRVANLLSGQLDPELTKFDEMGATVEAVDPVPVDSLDLHPELHDLIGDRFDRLLPVQSLAANAGLLDGDDQLVVSATATGKTLVGELAGLNRAMRGEGKLLFLVPLVALANQKYGDFTDEYGHLVNVTIRVGASRIRDGGESFDPSADVIVGTYEGVDHALRTGRDLGDIGTVVIDEVHMVGAGERGHRLDGLISRLKYYTEKRAQDRPEYDGAQWIYLSATVGNPEQLAGVLEATLIEFEERPVPIERHVTLVDRGRKGEVVDRLVRREYDRTSSKGYRGQTIVFTNSRRRCHELARQLDSEAAPYHAGLDYGKRKSVEGRFADQELATVVTTAALAAGVDFPASQVIFDALAMGIEWLSVQEFHQMLGRAGRPDYHDRGQVWLLVEPDGVYHHGMERTEDEVAFALLRGDMEHVTANYDQDAVVEETLANIVVSGAAAKRLNDRMLGTIDTTHAMGKLLEYGFIDGLEPTSRGRAVARHFLSPTAAFAVLNALDRGTAPFDLVADLELRETDD